MSCTPFLNEGRCVREKNMDKNYRRRIKAKLSLMDCDLSAARKMVYDLELFRMEGFREYLTNIQKISEEVIRLISELHTLPE
jgi:hypothetical protein